MYMYIHIQYIIRTKLGWLLLWAHKATKHITVTDDWYRGVAKYVTDDKLSHHHLEALIRIGFFIILARQLKHDAGAFI